jgi:nucleoid-associated protein YgaU
MAKLRLVVWMVTVGVAALVLLRDLTWSADDPAIAVMTAVRVAAGALAVYLFLATLLAVRLPRLAPRFVRRLVAGAVGTAVLFAPMTASASRTEPAPIDAPVIRRVPPTTEPAPETPPPAPADTEGPTEVVVVAGDHLWAIAERALAGRLGRPPSDAEIVPFWTALIDANRDRLASGDADLVFPGETIVLPS